MTPTRTRSTSDEPPDTAVALLDAAERLFAAHGVARTSVRAITAAADVHLAAVNYHFGSKEALVRAVLARRIEPLNDERLRRLEACPGDGPRQVERILEAFVGPVVEMARAGAGAEDFARLVSRALSDPDPAVRRLVVDQFREVADRFLAALAEARPDLDREELIWSLHFTVGALSHTVVNAGLLEQLLELPAADASRTTSRLVAWAAAGLARAGGAG